MVLKRTYMSVKGSIVLRIFNVPNILPTEYQILSECNKEVILTVMRQFARRLILL